MTPLAIEMLLHAHCNSDDFPNRDFPAQRAELEWLVAQDLVNVTPEDGRWTTTERGQAHMLQLCDLGLPIRGWMQASGAPIKARY